MRIATAAAWFGPILSRRAKIPAAADGAACGRMGDLPHHPGIRIEEMGSGAPISIHSDSTK